MEDEVTKHIRKNILDLQYNKYLQYSTTSVIILFTYLIGLALAFITQQIDYKDPASLVLSVIVTTLVVLFILLAMLHFKDLQQTILEELTKLQV